MAYYFASDFHLGLDLINTSNAREKLIIKWLDHIKHDAQVIYLLGDIFDYWFEYKEVVPKGHFRLLAKLAELIDNNIDIQIFTGNHDMWMFDYLEKEFDITIHRKPIMTEIEGKVFLLGHGDGLGPGDKKYKFIKKVFASKINQWLFARLHPNFAIRLMRYSSQKSRESELETIPFLGKDKEWLIQYCERKLEQTYADYFIFGHRHLPIDFTLSNEKSRYINTGDWIWHSHYARFKDGELELLDFKE